MDSDDLSESYNYCYCCYHQFPINGSNESRYDDSDCNGEDGDDSNPFVFCSETCQYSYSGCDEDNESAEAEQAAVDPLLAILCDLADLDADQFNPSNSDAWFEYEDCDSGTCMPVQEGDSTSEQAR